MVHHASIDRLWVVWQQLQGLRYRPTRGGECLRRTHGLHPFDYGSSMNPLAMTRENSSPDDAADQSNFDYWYDNLDVNGLTVAQTKKEIDSLRNLDRLYAGFVLYGLKLGGMVTFYIHPDNSDDDIEAGHFAVLGGEKEMVWAYERVYKYDITEIAAANGLSATSDYHFT
jgi:hypothetical protein